MAITFDAQVRFGGIHEWDPTDDYRGCYNPVGSVTPPVVAASADTTVDWGNVLVCPQASASEERWVEYTLGVRPHGNSQVSTGVFNKDRHTLRLGLRVRVPTEAFGAGEGTPFLSIRASSGTEYARVGWTNDAGTLRMRVMAPGGAWTASARSVTPGTWYDLDILYSKLAGTISLYSSPAGTDTWSTEVELAGVTGMEVVGRFRMGALGSLKTAPSGVHRVEIHSFRSQFVQARQAFSTDNTRQGRLSAADHADFRVDGTTDWWLSTWVMVESTGGDHAIAGKGDVGTSQEWQLLWNKTLGKYQLLIASTAAPTTDQAVTVGDATVAGNWEHLLCWYDSGASTINIRRNGGAIASAAFTGTPNAAANQLLFGCRTTGGTRGAWHNGRIGCTGLGKMAAGTLAAQIGALTTALYNGGVPVYGDFLDPALAASVGLISYWDLDDFTATWTDRLGTHPLTRAGTIYPKQGATVRFAPSQAASRAGCVTFPATRLGDVDPTRVAPCLFIRPGEWRAVTHARFVVGTAADLAGATAGAWTAVSGATEDVAYMLHLPPPAGLASDTRHYYRYELSRDGATAHVQGPIQYFRTLPAIGSTAVVHQHYLSCTRFADESHSLTDVADMLDYCDAQGIDLHRTFHLGDLYYEWTQDKDGLGANTPAQFVRLGLSAMYDPVLVRLCAQTVMAYMPSDHEVFNGLDSEVRVNPTARACVWDSAAALDYYNPQATYPAGRTLGEIFDAAEPLFHGWMFGMRLGTPATGLPASVGSGRSWNQSSVLMEYGRVWELQIDNLVCGRVEGGFKCLGPELRTWVDAQIAAFATDADADLLVIIASTPLNKVYTTSSGWWTVSKAEVNQIVDLVVSTVTNPDKGVMVIGGDHHAGGVWADRAFEGAAGIVSPPWGQANPGPWKLNMGVSPSASVSSHGSMYAATNADVAPYVGHFWDPTNRYGIGGGDLLIKASGGLMTLDQAAGTWSAQYWTDFGVNYQPAALQDMQVMAASAPANSPPDAPPAPVASLVDGTLTLTTSAYHDADGDPHAATRWQVQLAGGDWSAPIFDSGEDTTNLLSITIDASAWPPGDYVPRVRHAALTEP